MGYQRPGASPTDVEVERIARAIIRAMACRRAEDAQLDVLSPVHELAPADEERVVVAIAIELLIAGR